MKPQAKNLVNLFAAHHNRMTLSELLQTDLAREFSGRMSELRDEGYKIECKRAKSPSDNLYIMTAPNYFDAQGQGFLIPEPSSTSMRMH